VKRLAVKVARRGSKGEDARDRLKSLYSDLLGHVDGILTWALEIAKGLRAKESKLGLDGLVALEIADKLEHYNALGVRVVDQTRRRVLAGEVVPNDEKLFSIFEPHTELLKRGKAGKDMEFGHMIQILQVRKKFITDYSVFERKPVEHALVNEALERHKDLFGSYPETLAADKGYYEDMRAIGGLEEKVRVVSIAKKGARTQEEKSRERDPLFRLAQRFRAGVEGTISFLKRALRLARCMNKGWQHFAATVGATVFAHNLLVLSHG
jgi:IS5 family transposase